MSVSPKNGEYFTLEEMQGFVNGYIEFVYLDDLILVVNEEGLIHELPLNEIASVVACQTLVGDVLVCNNNEVR